MGCVLGFAACLGFVIWTYVAFGNAGAVYFAVFGPVMVILGGTAAALLCCHTFEHDYEQREIERLI